MQTQSSLVRSLFALSIPLIVAACGSPEQRAQDYYEKGIALIDKKDDAAARLELLKSIKYKNDKVEAWKALAEVNERTKAYSALFDDLRRIVELDPKDVGARVKLGKMLLAGGAPEAARTVVDAAGAAADQNSSLLSLKAEISMRLRDPASGVVEASKANELDPGDVDAAIVLASNKLSKGDTDGAFQILSTPAVASKDDARVNELKAQIFSRKGDFAQAESILRKLIEQRPQEVRLRNQIAGIFIAQRRFDDAEKELRAIVEANPDSVEAEMNLVRFLAEVKGAGEAKKELSRRIQAGGNVFQYKIAMAELDFSSGKFDDSVALLRDLIQTPGSEEHTVEAQAKLAELYLRRSDFSNAEKVADDILTKDPNNITALSVRAATRIQENKIEGAISDIRQALNGRPKAPNLLVLLGTAYEKDGKPELAERQFADAAKAAPNNAAIVLQYVSFLQRQGRGAQAEDVLADATSTNPQSIELLKALAQIRLANRNWAGALAVANSIQSTGDKSGVADQVRGAAYSGQNKVEESVQAFEAAHNAAPDAIAPVVSLVNIYLSSGKTEKADTLVAGMLKKFPDKVELMLLMGAVNAAKNDTAAAEANFKSAIEKQPKAEAGYIDLANLYSRQKNWQAASQTLQNGLDQLPNNISMQLALAGVLIGSRDYDGAIARYEAILKENDNVPLAQNNLASLLLDNRTDKQSFNQAYALAEKFQTSSVPQLQDTWGWALYRHGDVKKAIDVLVAVEAKLPKLASVRYHLGMSYIAAGQVDAGREQLNQALALGPDSDLREKIEAALKQ